MLPPYDKFWKKIPRCEVNFLFCSFSCWFQIRNRILNICRMFFFKSTFKRKITRFFLNVDFKKTCHRYLKSDFGFEISKKNYKIKNLLHNAVFFFKIYHRKANSMFRFLGCKPSKMHNYNFFNRNFVSYNISFDKK